MTLFSVQTASSAETERRSMGAAGAAVDDADGIRANKVVDRAMWARCARQEGVLLPVLDLAVS